MLSELQAKHDCFITQLGKLLVAERRRRLFGYAHESRNDKPLMWRISHGVVAEVVI
jgi:hypothetical protein